MSNGFNEEIDEVEVEDILYIPVEVGVVVDILDIVHVKEGVASTSQRPHKIESVP